LICLDQPEIKRKIFKKLTEDENRAFEKLISIRKSQSSNTVNGGAEAM